MLDVRQHIFYFCALFITLAIGILIGSSLNAPEQVRRQAKSIHDLRLAANQVIQERDEAKDRLAKDEGALDHVWPALVHGKLAGRRVVLIQTGDYADATQKAAESAMGAGASVAATVALTDRWTDLADDERAQGLHALARAVTSGTGAGPAVQAGLSSLEDQDLATVTGDLTRPCDLIVLVGGGKGDPAGDTGLDSALPEQLAQAGGQTVTTVGCEPYGAAVSSVRAYQNAGIATVDCIDLPLGQLALPFALRGDADDYGLKATAKRALPAALEEAGAS